MNSKYRYEILAVSVLALASALLMYLGANNILDTKLYYSHEEALAFLNGLTAEATENNKLIGLLDLFVYIPAYTWILILFAKRSLPEKYWIFTVVPTVFDIVETSVIYLYLTGILKAFPAWTGYVTSAKWIAGALVVLAIGANLFKKPAPHDI